MQFLHVTFIANPNRNSILRCNSDIDHRYTLKANNPNRTTPQCNSYDIPNKRRTVCITGNIFGSILASIFKNVLLQDVRYLQTLSCIINPTYSRGHPIRPPATSLTQLLDNSASYVPSVSQPSADSIFPRHTRTAVLLAFVKEQWAGRDCRLHVRVERRHYTVLLAASITLAPLGAWRGSLLYTRTRRAIPPRERASSL